MGCTDAQRLGLSQPSAAIAYIGKCLLGEASRPAPPVKVQEVPSRDWTRAIQDAIRKAVTSAADHSDSDQPNESVRLVGEWLVANCTQWQGEEEEGRQSSDAVQQALVAEALVEELESMVADDEVQQALVAELEALVAEEPQEMAASAADEEEESVAAEEEFVPDEEEEGSTTQGDFLMRRKARSQHRLVAEQRSAAAGEPGGDDDSAAGADGRQDGGQGGGQVGALGGHVEGGAAGETAAEAEADLGAETEAGADAEMDAEADAETDGAAEAEAEGRAEGDGNAHVVYDAARYNGIESILRALDSGHVQLVRLSFLLKLAKEGGVLKRRQELPAEAFIGADELLVVYESPGLLNDRDNVLPIIAISHTWCTPSHPDPHGDTLKVVAAALERENEKYIEFFSEMGVFWDWSSLYQKNAHSILTDAESKGFHLALTQTMDLWCVPP